MGELLLDWHKSAPIEDPNMDLHDLQGAVGLVRYMDEADGDSGAEGALRDEITALEQENTTLQQEVDQLSDFLDDALQANHTKPTQQTNDAIGGDGYYFIRNIYGPSAVSQAGSYWLYIYQQGNTVYLDMSWQGGLISYNSKNYAGGVVTTYPLGGTGANSTTTTNSTSFTVVNTTVGSKIVFKCTAQTTQSFTVVGSDNLDNLEVTLEVVQQSPLILQYNGAKWRNGDSTF